MRSLVASSCLSTLLVALAIVLSAGCGRPTPKDEPLRPSQIDNFDQLFATHCTGCHGVEGKLGPAPPLNDPMFLAIISEDELRRVVSEGREGTMMPSFARQHGGDLTPLQIGVLIEGVRNRWSTPVADAEALPKYQSDTEPPAHPADLASSEKLFEQQCGSCHGAEGAGASAGPVKVPAFLALVSDQALRRVIITGRPDLEMPDFRERAQMTPGSPPLTSAQIDELVALLASWRDSGHLPSTHQQAGR